MKEKNRSIMARYLNSFTKEVAKKEKNILLDVLAAGVAGVVSCAIVAIGHMEPPAEEKGKRD